MSGGNTAVFGIYPDETELAEGIEQLKRSGFRTLDLSILVPENVGTKDIGHEKHTKAPEGAAAGALLGALLGAAIGWLISTGMIAAPVSGAGTLMVAMLAGAGALGTVGGLLGALIGVFRPEYEAKRYEGRMHSGRVLLSVHCDNADWRVRAKKVLRNSGADGIASTHESKADFGRSQKPRPRAEMTGPMRQHILMPGSRPVFEAEVPVTSNSEAHEIAPRT